MKVGIYATSKSLAKQWKQHLNEHQILDFASELMLMEKIDTDCVDVLCLENSPNAKNLTKEILQVCPSVRIFLLSKEPNFNEGREFLAIGVKGYGNAHMLQVHLNDAILSMCSGNIWLYPEFIQSMILVMTKDSGAVSGSKVLDNLTAKEKDVANFIAQGLTNQEIADAANITLRTVKAHISAIFEKTGVKDRINLVLLMKKSG